MEVESEVVDNQINNTDKTIETPQDEEMTAIDENQKPSDEMKSSVEETSKPEDTIREKMLDHIANKTDVHFKSQQLGEPDLSFSEKRSIAENVLNQSHSTFLSRFGNNLLMEHLPYFANSVDEESYEVQYYINKLKSCQCKPVSNVQIKNRRFEAMKRLMSEGEYFSVGEMRKRNPLLFDQLLGNFLANPEFKTTDDQEHAVAHLLLEQIEQDRVAELKKQQMETELQQKREYCDSSDEDDTPKDDHESETWKEMKSNLALWGKSYKNNHTIGKTRWKNKHLKPRNAKIRCNLSQEEKVLLINEFTSSMFNSFLQGKDEFNYSEVDNNPEYDDVNQCDVDEEEKYFDSESPEEKNINNKHEEEDELDTFMKNIESEITSENLADSFQRMNAQNKDEA